MREYETFIADLGDGKGRQTFAIPEDMSVQFMMDVPNAVRVETYTADLNDGKGERTFAIPGQLSSQFRADVPNAVRHHSFGTDENPGAYTLPEDVWGRINGNANWKADFEAAQDEKSLARALEMRGLRYNMAERTIGTAASSVGEAAAVGGQFLKNLGERAVEMPFDEEEGRRVIANGGKTPEDPFRRRAEMGGIDFSQPPPMGEGGRYAASTLERWRKQVAENHPDWDAEKVEERARRLAEIDFGAEARQRQGEPERRSEERVQKMREAGNGYTNWATMARKYADYMAEDGEMSGVERFLHDTAENAGMLASAAASGALRKKGAEMIAAAPETGGLSAVAGAGLYALGWGVGQAMVGAEAQGFYEQAKELGIPDKYLEDVGIAVGEINGVVEDWQQLFNIKAGKGKIGDLLPDLTKIAKRAKNPLAQKILGQIIGTAASMPSEMLEEYVQGAVTNEGLAYAANKWLADSKGSADDWLKGVNEKGVATPLYTENGKVKSSWGKYWGQSKEERDAALRVTATMGVLGLGVGAAVRQSARSNANQTLKMFGVKSNALLEVKQEAVDAVAGIGDFSGEDAGRGIAEAREKAREADEKMGTGHQTQDLVDEMYENITGAITAKRAGVESQFAFPVGEDGKVQWREAEDGTKFVEGGGARVEFDPGAEDGAIYRAKNTRDDLARTTTRGAIATLEGAVVGAETQEEAKRIADAISVSNQLADIRDTAKRRVAEQLAKGMGRKVEIFQTSDELLAAHGDEMSKGKDGTPVEGFDPNASFNGVMLRNGAVAVVLDSDDNKTVGGLADTIWHESNAHAALRNYFGHDDRRLRRFLSQVGASVPDISREEVERKFDAVREKKETFKDSDEYFRYRWNQIKHNLEKSGYTDKATIAEECLAYLSQGRALRTYASPGIGARIGRMFNSVFRDIGMNVELTSDEYAVLLDRWARKGNLFRGDAAPEPQPQTRTPKAPEPKPTKAKTEAAPAPATPTPTAPKAATEAAPEPETPVSAPEGATDLEKWLARKGIAINGEGDFKRAAKAIMKERDPKRRAELRTALAASLPEGMSEGDLFPAETGELPVAEQPAEPKKNLFERKTNEETTPGANEAPAYPTDTGGEGDAGRAARTEGSQEKAGAVAAPEADADEGGGTAAVATPKAAKPESKSDVSVSEHKGDGFAVETISQKGKKPLTTIDFDTRPPAHVESALRNAGFDQPSQSTRGLRWRRFGDGEDPANIIDRARKSGPSRQFGVPFIDSLADRGFKVKENTDGTFSVSGKTFGIKEELKSRKFVYDKATGSWKSPGRTFIAKNWKDASAPAEEARVETGKPFKAKMFRGEGRAKSEVYAGVQVPVAGDGLYLVFTEDDARNYGDNISSKDVELKNPLVIRNDGEWANLIEKAGLKYGNPYGLDEAETKAWASKLRETVMNDGHDGLVLRFFEANYDTDDAKTLGRVFGHDQVVVYGNPNIKQGGEQGQNREEAQAAQAAPAKPAKKRETYAERNEQTTEAAAQPEPTPAQPTTEAQTRWQDYIKQETDKFLFDLAEGLARLEDWDKRDREIFRAAISFPGSPQEILDRGEKARQALDGFKDSLTAGFDGATFKEEMSSAQNDESRKEIKHRYDEARNEYARQKAQGNPLNAEATENTESAPAKPAETPAAQPQEKAATEDVAFDTDVDGNPRPLAGFLKPTAERVSKGAFVLVRSDDPRNRTLYYGEIVSIGPKNIKIKNRSQHRPGGPIDESILTFSRSKIVGVEAEPGDVAKENERGFQNSIEDMEAVDAALETDKKDDTNLYEIVEIARKLRNGLKVPQGAEGRKHYRLAPSNDALKASGLIGDFFTIRQGVITRHDGKDASHAITPQEWVAIAKALQDPILIERYKPKELGDGSFRVWTDATIDGKNAIVGVLVKSSGKDMSVNSVSTVFGADDAFVREENIVYDKRTRSEREQSVLVGHGSRRYPVRSERSVSRTDNSLPQSGEKSSAEAQPKTSIPFRVGDIRLDSGVICKGVIPARGQSFTDADIAAINEAIAPHGLTASIGEAGKRTLVVKRQTKGDKGGYIAKFNKAEAEATTALDALNPAAAQAPAPTAAKEAPKAGQKPQAAPRTISFAKLRNEEQREAAASALEKIDQLVADVEDGKITSGNATGRAKSIVAGYQKSVDAMLRRGESGVERGNLAEFDEAIKNVGNAKPVKAASSGAVRADVTASAAVARGKAAAGAREKLARILSQGTIEDMQDAATETGVWQTAGEANEERAESVDSLYNDIEALWAAKHPDAARAFFNEQIADDVIDEAEKARYRSMIDMLDARAYGEAEQRAAESRIAARIARKDSGAVRFSRGDIAKQGALSGGTSRNQNPSGNRYAARVGIFRPGTRNVDIGAGRFDKATEFLAGLGVQNIPFDPVNRGREENERAAQSVRDNPADTATIHNVLNVIDNDAVMEGIINQAARAIKKDGTAVFSIYEGDRSGNGKATRDGYQRNARTKDYLPAIGKFFGDVEQHGEVIVAKNPKDVGPAFWAFDENFEDGVRFSRGDISDDVRKAFANDPETRNWTIATNPSVIANLPPQALKILPPVTERTDNNSVEKAMKQLFTDFGEVRNIVSGERVVFNRADAGKMMMQSGADMRTLSPHLKALFENAVPAWSETPLDMPGHREHKDVVGYHNYVAKFIDANETENFVRFTVREQKSGRQGVHAATVSEVAIYKNAEGTSAPANKSGEASRIFVDKRLSKFLGKVKGNSGDGDVRFSRSDILTRDAIPEVKQIVDAHNASAAAATPPPGIMDRPESNMDRIRRATQDAMLPERRFEEDLGVRPEDSAYLAEDRRYGLDDHQTRALINEAVMPIFDRMVQLNIAKDDLDKFLMAHFADERNKMIADRTSNVKADGSGLAPLEAARIRQLYKDRGMEADLQSVADMVYKMNRETLERLVSAGLLARAQADRWMELSPHYVPLRTMLEDDAEFDVNAAITRLESKHALGRSTTADSPLIYSILQAEQAIVRANKNAVRQKLAAIVRTNPETGVVINGQPVKRALVNGKVVFTIDRDFREKRNLKDTGKDNVVQFKEDGELKYIVLNGERGKLIARAVTKYGMSGMDNKFWETSMRMNRFLANTRTAWSLPFLVRNLGYDTEQVAITMNMDGLHKASLFYARNILSGSAIRAAHDYFKHGSYDGELGHYMKEYVENGGLIKGGTSEGFDETTDQIAKNLGLSTTKLGRAMDKTLVTRLVKGGWNGLLDLIEKANTNIETQTRLAVYAALRENDWTPEEAVSYTRDVTVNFNRKGEVGQNINNLWIFANASIQDMERIARSVAGRGRSVHNGERSSLWSRGITLSALAMVGVLMSLAGGDDDDDEMENMTEYSKQTSLYRRLGKTKYYLRLGQRGPYTLVPYVAQKLSDISIGKINTSDAAADITEYMFALALDPLNGQIMHNANGRGIDIPRTLASMVPTEPGKFLFGQIIPDRTFTGEPLTRKRWNDNLPLSHNGKERTASSAKWAAETINAITGGDQYTPGHIDIPPEYIELVFSTTLGSLGSDTMRTVGTIQDIANGEFNPERVPFLRDFVRKIPDNTQRFYEAQSRQKGYETSAKGYRAGHDWAKVREFEAGHPSAKQGVSARLREKAKLIKNLREQEARLTVPAAERVHQRRTKLQSEYIELVDK